MILEVISHAIIGGEYAIENGVVRGGRVKVVGKGWLVRWRMREASFILY